MRIWGEMWRWYIAPCGLRDGGEWLTIDVCVVIVVIRRSEGTEAVSVLDSFLTVRGANRV